MVYLVLCLTFLTMRLSLQRTLRNMLYYVLDITAQDFSYLKTSQRLWIFVNIFYNQFKKLNTSAERRFFFNQYLPLEYINGNYNNIFSNLLPLMAWT